LKKGGTLVALRKTLMETFSENAAPISDRTVSESRANAGRTGLPCSLSRTFTYRNPLGLHARPAALVVKSLSDFQCGITAECEGEQANAKSILGLLCLAVGHKSRVTFTATGPDAPEAMAAIAGLFAGQLAGQLAGEN
jgi:phosphocarrier protein HPr